MRTTPIEIRQKQFEKKTFGGVDGQEVQAYLQTLSQEWERMNEELAESRRRADTAQKDAQELRKIETSLYSALRTAEETGASMVEKTKQQTSLQLREAQLKAEGILKEAGWQAKTMLEETRQEARRTYQQLRQQVSGLEREVNEIERYRDNLLAELQLLSTDITDRVERYRRQVKHLDLSQGHQHHEPDFTPTPELAAALNKTTLSGNESEALTESPEQQAPQSSSSEGPTENEAREENSGNFFDNLNSNS